MNILIKSNYQPEQILSLDEVNSLLKQGHLDGEESAWTSDLQQWTQLKKIKGVALAQSAQRRETPYDVLPTAFDGPRTQEERLVEKQVSESKPLIREKTKKKSFGATAFKLAIVVALTIGGLAFIGTEHIPAHYQIGPYLAGSAITLNLIPLIICSIIRLIGRSKVRGKLFPLYIGMLCLAVYFSWVGREARSLTITHEEGNYIGTLTSNPNLFVSDEFNFGILFPSSQPGEIVGEHIAGNAMRYQVGDWNKHERLRIYSVTATTGKKPEKLEVEELLSTTADVTLMLSNNSDYNTTKRFGSWNNRMVLRYDSEIEYEGMRLPKSTILLFRDEDDVMFDISVIGTRRETLEEDLNRFFSTFILITHPIAFQLSQ